MAFYLKLGPVVLGRKHLEASRFWIPSAVLWGACATIFICHATDYSPVMTKVPYYREIFRYPYEDDKIVAVKPMFPLPK